MLTDVAVKMTPHEYCSQHFVKICRIYMKIEVVACAAANQRENYTHGGDHNQRNTVFLDLIDIGVQSCDKHQENDTDFCGLSEKICFFYPA